MKPRPKPILWLSNARGIYLPRKFARSFADRAKSVKGDVNAESWTILEDPDHEAYWDAWQDVLDHATVTDDRGIEYKVYQDRDGDCWLIPAGMEWSDERDFFVWPDNDEED